MVKNEEEKGPDYMWARIRSLDFVIGKTSKRGIKNKVSLGKPLCCNVWQGKGQF